MKQSLLVAIASAAIGAAVATLLVDRAPPAVRTARGERSGGINVAALEIAFVRALERVGDPVVQRPRDPASPPEAGTPTATPDPGVMVRQVDEPRMLPPANIDNLVRLRAFDDDAEFRRGWIFRSMRGVLKDLGTPDSVYMNAGAEQWTYKFGEGEDATLVFHRGRLINLYR